MSLPFLNKDEERELEYRVDCAGERAERRYREQKSDVLKAHQERGLLKSTVYFGVLMDEEVNHLRQLIAISRDAIFEIVEGKGQVLGKEDLTAISTHLADGFRIAGKTLWQRLQSQMETLGPTVTGGMHKSFRCRVDQGIHQEALAQVTIRAAELRRRQRAATTGTERSISQSGTTSVGTTMNLKVFIIHGHDEAKWRELKEMLEDRFELDVVIMQQQAGRSRTFIEKFEQEAKPCNAAIALLTPDDIIHEEGEECGQPRPNVVFELGWFAGKYGRHRTLMVVREGTKIPSDLFGIELIFFRKNVDEKIQQLEKEIKEWKGKDASILPAREDRKPQVKWGCYVWEDDEKLYCPACFDTTGMKYMTTRMNIHERKCTVCGRVLPSG